MKLDINDTIFRSCAFVLKLNKPLNTLTKISELLAQKTVRVSSLYAQFLEKGDAVLVIHCVLEKDKIAYIGRHFERMSGVTEVDWMNARTRIKQF